MIKNITKSLLFFILTNVRRLAYNILGFIDRYILRQKNLVSILAYHSIGSDDWRFSIDPKTMKKQIGYLKKNFQFISLKTVERYINGELEITKPSIVLTFDDGYKDILQMKKYLKKQNIKPALFLISDSENANIEEIGREKSYLNIREIKGLIADGWEIGCHSNTHANLSKLGSEHLRREIVDAGKSIESSLGIKIKYFAYPRGKYSNRVLKLVKASKYTLGLTMDDGFINKGINPLTIPRIGIDRTHTFSEFKSAFSPSVVKFRKFIKNTLVGRYL